MLISGYPRWHDGKGGIAFCPGGYSIGRVVDYSSPITPLATAASLVPEGVASVLVEVALDDLMTAHAEGAAGADCDEHDLLHRLAWGEDTMPYDSSYEVVGVRSSGALVVRYSTRAEPTV